MRVVVYGAGAIGGVIGGRLFEHGHDVALIARGAHGRELRQKGLRLESVEGTATLAIPTFERPAEASIGPDDVVVLAMKTQDCGAALDDLASASTRGPAAVVCAQNGVENERMALRRFAAVYGVCVMCPTTHLDAGVVRADSSPTTGILDIGRYPFGADETASEIAARFASSSFV